MIEYISSLYWSDIKYIVTRLLCGRETPEREVLFDREVSMSECLDYEGLYEKAKAQAKAEARLYYPACEKKRIEKEEIKLTNKYYAQMVTPPPY